MYSMLSMFPMLSICVGEVIDKRHPALAPLSLMRVPFDSGNQSRAKAEYQIPSPRKCRSGLHRRYLPTPMREGNRQHA